MAMEKNISSNILAEIERDSKHYLDYLTLLLSYGKYIPFKEFRSIINELSFEEKLEISHRIIEESLRITRLLYRSVVPAIGFSGGKDSLAVLDLVLEHVRRDEIYVIYANTLIEYPGSRNYVIKIVKEIFNIKNLIEIVPKVSPWQLWKIFGFPLYKRSRYYTPVCCVILKELPVKIAIEKFGINIDFNGIRGEESNPRFRSLADNGLIRRTKYIGREVTLKKAIIRVAPIGIWNTNDVYFYIKRKGLPLHPAYDNGLERVGCVACLNHKKWKESILKINERLHDYITQKVKEWGYQRERIRFSKLRETLKISDINKLYIIRKI